MRARLLIGFTALFLPLQLFAAPATFKALVGELIVIFNQLVYVIFALAFIAFLWGVFRYMFFPESEENVKKGKQIIVWGILVLAIMASVWGIVNVLHNTFF